MIDKIQNSAVFKGVYIKRNGQTQKNLHKAYDDLAKNSSLNDIIPMTESQRTSFNATLDYGLKQLNESKMDDGVTRYLTAYPFYSEAGLVSGYSLGIQDKDGNLVASGTSYMDGVGVYTLKTAFDYLKESYNEFLSKAAIQRYSENYSLDSIIDRFATDDVPENA